MSACADQELLLHGLLDGELDALNTLACEAHLRVCAGCAAELKRLEALRARLRAPGVSFPAPELLRARLAAQLPGPVTAAVARAPRAAVWSLAAAAAAAALILGGWLGWVLFANGPASGIAEQLLASHMRSLLAEHLTDVNVSDQHVVKPWFNGKVNFAPPVPDLSAAGFTLAGGRLDYVDGRVVAVVVYHRRLHVINLYMWPAQGTVAPLATQRQGYGLVHWRVGDLQLWAVSDVEMAELQRFRAEFTQRLQSAPP